MKNQEIIFLVEESLEGGFETKALGESIFTQAETVSELRENIKDAIKCHFEFENMPKMIILEKIL